jgi:hypothetical protein
MIMTSEILQPLKPYNPKSFFQNKNTLQNIKACVIKIVQILNAHLQSYVTMSDKYLHPLIVFVCLFNLLCL